MGFILLVMLLTFFHVCLASLFPPLLPIHGFADAIYDLVAGLPTDKAFDMSIGYLAVGFVGTLLSWYLLSLLGRRFIYNTGLLALSLLMFLIGILDCAPNYSSRPGVIWAQSAIMVIWNGIYGLTIGPVCFVIICEASATRVRGKTIAVATAVQALMGIVMTVAIPYMINPDQADMRGKLGFFFGGLAFIYTPFFPTPFFT